MAGRGEPTLVPIKASETSSTSLAEQEHFSQVDVWLFGCRRQWCTHYRYHIGLDGSEYLPSEYVLTAQQELFLTEKRTPECFC